MMDYQFWSNFSENDWRVSKGKNEVLINHKRDGGVMVKIGWKKDKLTIMNTGGEVWINRLGKVAKIMTDGLPVEGKIFKDDKIVIKNILGEVATIEFINQKYREKVGTIEMIKSNRKINSIVGLIIILLLILTIGFGYQKNRQLAIDKQRQELNSQIESDLKKAETENNLTEAIEGALAVKEKVSQLEQHQENREIIQKYLQRIDQVLIKNGSPESVVYDLAYDTDLIDNDRKNYQQLVLKGKELFLIDRENSRIDKINLELRSVEKYSSDEVIKNIGSLALVADQLIGFDGAELKQIGRSETKNRGSFSVDGGQLISIEGWNGFVYFLDNQGGIYKSSGQNSWQQWLKSLNEKKEGAIDLAIDARVWVTDSRGEIVVYESGEKLTWKQESLPDNGAIKKVSSQPKSKQVIVMNDRAVYAYNKDNGRFEGKYNLEKIGIRDGAMTENGNEMVILAENQKIFRVKLRGEIF